jgi:hypothetical protein
MEVSCQLHSLAALIPGKQPAVYYSCLQNSGGKIAWKTAVLDIDEEIRK